MLKSNKIYPIPDRDVRLKYHKYRYTSNKKQALIADGGLAIMVTILCVAF